MTDPGGFGGRLRLHPGQPVPHNLHGTRPQWAARLARGRPATALPGLLASLFNLCGPVHRLCAQRAVAAASGQHAPPTAAERLALQHHTLREHLQRVMLDWPRALAGAGADEAQAAVVALAGCPLWAADRSAPPDATRAATATWLAALVFGQPLDAWLAAWQADPAAALRHWAAATTTPVARWLARAQAVAAPPDAATPVLRVHADAAALRTLAGQLAADAELRRRPLWQGRCAETGAWARLAEPQPQRLNTPALRLGARLAELARLALPDDGLRQGADGLALGALPLGEGQAIAWVEMARGLLLHWVRLQTPATAPTEGPRVLDCAVIAPTEWNFHPAGAVAQALAGLPAVAQVTAADRPSALALLLAAYDPCMPCDIDPLPAPATEARDA